MRFFVCAVFAAVLTAVGVFVLQPVHVPLVLPPLAPSTSASTSTSTTTTTTAPPPTPPPTDDVWFRGGRARTTTNGFDAIGSGAADLRNGQVANTRLMAERAAKLDAIRNLVEHINEQPLTDGRLVRDVLSAEAVGLNATGCRVMDTRYYSDGSVDVVVALPRAAIDAAIAPARLR